MATINGGTGNDILAGKNETDIVNGLAGNDSLTGNQGDDTLNGGIGNDKMAGGAGNDGLQGDAGLDVLDGGAGNDTLTDDFDGDTLKGGTGNDTYVVKSFIANIVETANAGIDTVACSGISFSLANFSNVENLILTGNINGVGTGNDLANKITGGDNANLLDGRKGNDTLDGGAGNDVYVVGATASTIVEAASAGIDEIRVVNLGIGLSFSLETLVNVEDLTLLGGADDLGLGNKLANRITGGSGANQLFGLDGNDTLDGGMGFDQLIGGFGNDTYFVDAFEDAVLEGKGQGRDAVIASDSYELDNDQEIENLTLTGIGNTIGIGNNLANVITGNAGNNTLFGGGADDVMAGGKGDDTYTVEQAGDRIVEAANAGIDTVQSQLERYTLTANVENLTLTIGFDGTGNGLANEITGNILDNKLDGGAGNDKLFGLGGADTLIGGTGSDELFGGNGIDTLISGAGDGVLEGGFGADVLVGGTGLDNFVYAVVVNASDLTQLGGDSIQGFTKGIDQIDIRDLLGDDPNDFELAFDTHVDLQKIGKDTQIFFDNVLLATVTNAALSESDFVLTV